MGKYKIHNSFVISLKLWNYFDILELLNPKDVKEAGNFSNSESDNGLTQATDSSHLDSSRTFPI